MFGIFKSKKAEKVNLNQVAQVLERRNWQYEMVDGSDDTIVVKEKYRNKMKDFYKLYLQFVGGAVKFKDQRGNLISEVPQSKMYPEMMDILNVLP